MNRIAVIAVLVVAMPACAPGPCPEGQARDNGGKCVALAPPAAQANVFDQFDPPAPTKDEYIADQSDGIVLAPGAAERINAQNEADFQRRRAERLADERTDRVVEAQRETQAKLDEIEDKL